MLNYANALKNGPNTEKTNVTTSPLPASSNFTTHSKNNDTEFPSLGSESNDPKKPNKFVPNVQAEAQVAEAQQNKSKLPNSQVAEAQQGKSNSQNRQVAKNLKSIGTGANMPITTYKPRTTQTSRENFGVNRDHKQSKNFKNFSEETFQTYKKLLTDEREKLLQRFSEPKENMCYKLIQGDLFNVDESYSLAHCVSVDFQMGKGIAVEFHRRFDRVDELKQQNVKEGGFGLLKTNNGDRCIFYLVTKKFYFSKPLYSALEQSLISMRDYCIENKLKKLAMPKIGAGLDKLEWDLVSRIIDDVFAQTDMDILVYEFHSAKKNGDSKRPDANSSPSSSRNSKKQQTLSQTSNKARK